MFFFCDFLVVVQGAPSPKYLIIIVNVSIGGYLNADNAK